MKRPRSSREGKRQLALQPPRSLRNKIAKEIIPQLASELIYRNKLTLRGQSGDELFGEFREATISYLNDNNVILNLIADYRGNLLLAARSYRRAKEFEFATLFYATYIEHQLNGVIALGCQRTGNAALVKQVIRETNMASKCGWILAFLGLHPISALWQRRILDLSDRRNAFVHYKWQPNSDGSESSKNKESNILVFAEGIVRYLRRYEDKAFHANQGAKLRKLARSQR